MNQSRSELLRMWLDLLRSGHYSQAQEVLYDGTGFCCLGVAADGIFNVKWVEDEHSPSQFDYLLRYDGEDLLACDNELLSVHSEALGLTRRVKDSAEQAMLNGVASHIAGEDIVLFESKNDTNMREYILMRLNDKFNFSFEQIADFIEMSGWITEAEQEESEATVQEVTDEI